MGADIHGWVETRQHARASWDGGIRIRSIVYRQYGMFASLFGVRNGDAGNISANGRFRAIAPGRGIPPGVCQEYIDESHGIGESWALWSELAIIDWEEEGKRYILGNSVFAEPGLGRRLERRRDYFNGGWVTLFRLMEVLAEQFGADNVRLSVWFDQL